MDEEYYDQEDFNDLDSEQMMKMIEEQNNNDDDFNHMMLGHNNIGATPEGSP
tara:strand:+ start:1466 stop:1621 length:156 start_codon:yes stop_codon:yes gene_type:complete